jgi:hypothetical protein
MPLVILKTELVLATRFEDPIDVDFLQPGPKLAKIVDARSRNFAKRWLLPVGRDPDRREVRSAKRNRNSQG